MENYSACKELFEAIRSEGDFGLPMTPANIICAVTALCFAIWTMTNAHADQASAQESTKRYHGSAYGSPQRCAWQACATDDDCVAIDTDPCLGPIAVNRESAASAQRYFDFSNIAIDCVRPRPSPPSDVECKNRHYRLKVNDWRNLCRQRTRSEDIIGSCLTDQPERCPEAAYRADVWALQPGYDEILVNACNRDHARSCYVLASNHHDSAEATALFTRACELEFAHSCYVLGRGFSEEDPFNAWFYAACDIDANFCLQIGNGLRGEDAGSARSAWYRHGCDKGDAPSCAALESIERASQARQQAHERKVERNLAIDRKAREHWDRIVRKHPVELAGATFLGIERPKPGYTLTDYFTIWYSTKKGETKQLVLPVD